MIIEKKELLKYYTLFAVYTLAVIIFFLRPLDVQQWQWADDALYFNNAQSIVPNLAKEYWLGPFNKVVISKAPLFSVFIAAIHYLGIPLRLAEFFLFAPLPYFFLRAVRPLQIDQWKVLFSAALCLIFIPVAGVEYRLLRGTLFGALSIYCLVSLCGTIIRCGDGKGKPWPWAFFAGLALGLGATTREEASWLMVPTAFAILYFLLMAWQTRKLAKFIILVPLICSAYYLPLSFFSTLNYNSYGVFSPSLRQNSEFRDFFAILCSLNPDNRQRYVPINTNTRELAYGVSPIFAQLKEYLEGPALDQMARNKGHLCLNEWEDTEGREFFVSNFEFALTEAIILSGRNTGNTFLEFCQQATNEIRIAIENGRIEGGKSGFSMLPPIALSDADAIFFASFRSFWLLLQGKGQYRRDLSQTVPSSSIANKWHSYLRTSPYPSSGSEQISINFKNRIFKTIVDFFRNTYFFFLLLGLVAGTRAYMNKCDNYVAILVILLVGWTAVFAFCLAMGVVHVIGFPILKWPEGYNRLGFFPLHFLLLISIISFFYTLKTGISWTPHWLPFPKHKLK